MGVIFTVGASVEKLEQHSPESVTLMYTEHSPSYTKLDRKKLGCPKILQCPNCHILQAFCITTTTVQNLTVIGHDLFPSLTSCTLTTPNQLPWLVFIARPHCQLLPGSPRKEQKQFRGIAFLWQQGRGSAALMSAFEGNT